MYADICDPSGEEAAARFRVALRTLGAQLVGQSWAIGVDVYCVQIGDKELTVFEDAWSLDIEGAEDLVRRVLTEFKQTTV
jgi:hypothetical protein